jgi:shikimate dehydrogenase
MRCACDRETVFNLDDLARWERPGVSLAVVGSPIGHSRSPRMQNAALAAVAGSGGGGGAGDVNGGAGGGVGFADWRYHKFEVPPERLGEALALFFAKGFRGLNLTLPHKVLALPNLAEIAADAVAIGAVNTLVAGPRGYVGHNTDGLGFALALERDLGVGLRGADVVLLGAGGAARAVAVAALRGGCRELWIGNRSVARLAELRDGLAAALPGDAGRVRVFQLGQTAEAEAVGAAGDAGGLEEEDAGGLAKVALPAWAVVVNATSLGLKPGDPSPMPAAFWEAAPRRAAYDIVYGAGETAFLRDARVAGVPGADGLSMLCFQGALAFEIWTGQPALVEVMRRALSDEPEAALSPAEEGGFIATNPETGTTTEGETVDEALANLKEATELYLTEFPQR